ncbi:hypothetical protein BPTFM16_01821 [Altererythrobacter insulae]|nr:hypothetical protein BPTFM16_01821 [Altererythrobacter insulae]
MAATRQIRKRTGKYLASEVDGELILIQGDSGAFYSLTDVGLEIWEKLDQLKTVEQISAALQDDYDVSADVCEQAVAEFTTSLVTAGLAEYA